MPIQQVVHISLSIPLYHSIRSFQFMYICEESNRAFILLPRKNYKTYSELQQIFIANH
jgi:hypothetical protein